MAKIHDRIGAAALFVLCLLAWSRSARFPDDAIVFPRIVIALLAVLSVAMLAKTFLGSGVATERRRFFIDGRRFGLTALAILAYVVAVSVLGYFTATIVFLPLMALGLGYRRPFPLALMAAFFCGAVFLVFVVMFERPLPPERILQVF